MAETKQWKPEHYKQDKVQAHGGIDQQKTEYAVVKSCDMSEQMQQHAVDCVSFAFTQRRVLDDIAEIIKTEFDTMYLPTWHCVVGRDFGAYVTHETGRFIYFYIGQKGFLLWSTPSA